MIAIHATICYTVTSPVIEQVAVENPPANPTQITRGATIEQQKNWCNDISNQYYNPDTEQFETYSTLGEHVWRYDFRKVANNSQSSYQDSVLFFSKGFEEKYGKVGAKTASEYEHYIRFSQDISRNSTGIDSPNNIQSRYSYSPMVTIVKNSYGSFTECGQAVTFYNTFFEGKKGKTITIDEPMNLYVQRDGYQPVKFTPIVSGLYTFELTNSAMSIGDNTGTWDCILYANTTYTYNIFIDSKMAISCTGELIIHPKEIESIGNHNINNMLLNDETLIGANKDIILKYEAINTGLLNISITSSSLAERDYPAGSLSIIDKSGNLINKIGSQFGIAKNSSRSNNFYFTVIEGEIYYIKIHFPNNYTPNGDVFINLSYNVNTLSLNTGSTILYESRDSITVLGDNICKVNLPRDQQYRFHLYRSYSTNPNFILFTINAYGEVTILGGNIDDYKYASSVEVTSRFLQTVYVGYLDSTVFTSYTLMITDVSIPLSIPKYEFEADPDWAAYDAKGTECTVRNNPNTNEIGIGFSRSLFIYSDHPYANTSRLCFNYISSDPSKATVSQYGTVFALDTGTVTITALPKPGYGGIEQFTFEFTIVNSGSGVVQLTTDKNDPTSGSKNGTQVTIAGHAPGGNNIYIGYTRSICIVSGPSKLRQDYIWSSSNESIAAVDQWGYVIGVRYGSVTITCISKLNNQWVGQFVIYCQP